MRHFPIASKHPRAPALHAAAEAAGLQGRLRGDVGLALADQGRTRTTRTCGSAPRASASTLERFDRERRSESVAERIRRDFEGGIRAGVAGTPAAFVAGQWARGDIAESLRTLADSA